MLILGIETASSQVGCAIGGHEGVLASAHTYQVSRHAENLAPQIDFVCRQADIDLTDLGAVAVDVGPGLFTGLRVGVATALSIAYAKNQDIELSAKFANAAAAIVVGKAGTATATIEEIEQLFTK